MISAAIDLLARSSLLLLLVWAAAAGVARAGGSAAMRHLIWLCGLLAFFMLPLLAALAPPLRLPILPASSPAPPEPTLSMPITPPAAEFGSPAGPDSAAAIGGALDPALTLYLIVALLLLGRLILGQVALARLWARAKPADAPAWERLLGELRAALAIRRSVALRLAPGPAMPMTWGGIRPRILLPAEAALWTEDRRRLVLLHELAHISRGDSLSRVAADAACALYWFQPAIWLAARRMRLEQEHACDDLVLSRGARPSSYARELLDIAIGFRKPALAGAMSIGMAGPSELERRLAAIVARGPRRRSGAAFAAGCAVAALLTTAMVATVAPVAALRPLPPRGVDGDRFGPAGAEQIRASLAVVQRSASDGALPLRSGTSAPLASAPGRPLEADAPIAAPAASGNRGNSGNSGNIGNPGRSARPGVPPIPATPPTLPAPATMPTPPTPPTIPTPLHPAPSSQGP